MAYKRRRRYSGTRTKKLEHRQWFSNSWFSNVTTTLKNGADTDNVVLIGYDPLKGDDQTILRTRGLVNIVASTLGADVLAVLGGIVLPNKVVNNASPSELPNPLVDTDSTNWFVWHPFMIPGTLADSGTETPSDAATVQTFEMPVDSKAKRIMEASESVAWILGMNSNGAVSSKTFTMSSIIRTLVGY